MYVHLRPMSVSLLQDVLPGVTTSPPVTTTTVVPPSPRTAAVLDRVPPAVATNSRPACPVARNNQPEMVADTAVAAAAAAAAAAPAPRPSVWTRVKVR